MLRNINIPPLVDPKTNTTETTDLRKATILAEHFVRVHTHNDGLGEPAFVQHVNAVVSQDYKGSNPSYTLKCFNLLIIS